jgi:hypothetical protein
LTQDPNPSLSNDRVLPLFAPLLDDSATLLLPPFLDALIDLPVLLLTDADTGALEGLDETDGLPDTEGFVNAHARRGVRFGYIVHIIRSDHRMEKTH